ncbi:MAG: VOC family protein [Cellulosilyticaceae bacterium]
MDSTVKDSQLISNNIVVQIAILVNDIETTMANWCNFLGVKNYGYKLTDAPEVSGILFKGQSTPARAKLGFVKLGQVTLEIIEPDHNASIWREYLDTHGEGFHHIAFKVDELDLTIAKFTSQNMPLLQTASYGSGQYAYMDTSDSLKLIVELLNDFK